MNFTALCFSGLPQYEATKSYMPKEPDELGLKEAELVIVLQKQEGETLTSFQSVIQCKFHTIKHKSVAVFLVKSAK